jgi:prepilin-type processing-associated H-X9-DG protein
VVAIIAVLAAILLPALNKSRAIVMLTDCTSRIRQMGIAMTMYNEENDQYWPGQYQHALGAMDYRTACAQYMGVENLVTYPAWNSGIRTQNPMMCPSSYSINRETASFWVPAEEGTYFDAITQPAAPAIVSGYTCNPYFGWTDRSPQQARRGQPPEPSKCLMLADAYREARPNYWYKTSGKSFFRFRHMESYRQASDGKMNMVFIDGHVTVYKFIVGGPIYPDQNVGDGLWSRQADFMWWANTAAASR